MTDPVPAWLFHQSAVIPWRAYDGAVRVALITSRSGKRWVIPKGVIDPGESARESAAREAEEEAGLLGTVSDEEVGRYEYEKWGGTCSVAVFLMQVERELERWDEADTRTRRWMSVDDAARAVREPALKRMILELEGVA